MKHHKSLPWFAWAVLAAGLTLVAPRPALARCDSLDVAAGRASVKAYVEFVHHVERVYEAIATPAHGHFDETTAEPR